MNPVISVVVPVYNVEKYLQSCVNSILQQSFQNFELILVDDGSTDSSGALCDLYKNDRIRVIHKQNGGLSDARNTGTQAALGTFITWIDSDDLIHKEYLEQLYQLVTENHADLATCEFLFCDEGERVLFPDGEFEKGTLDGKEALIKMLQGQLHGSSACALLLRREIAKKHLFPFGKYHEDDLTTYQFYYEAKKVAFTKRKLYCYFQRNNSIMHKPFGKADIAEMDAADELYTACSRYGTAYADAALVKKTRNYCQVAFAHAHLKEIDAATYQRIKAFLKSHLTELMRNNYLGGKEKIKILLYEMGLLRTVQRILGE